jgi:diguanylate cyclase (GGDEF)-like protein
VLITLVACSRFYALRYRKAEGNEKMQFRLLLMSSILPYIALVLVFFNVGNLGIDFTALILPPCIALINYALTKYNFLEIKEMARDRVFEDNRLGYLLLSKDMKIVDTNPLGKQLFKQIQDAKIPLEEWFETKENRLVKLDAFNKTLSLNMTPIESSGYLMAIEDVSEREAILNRLESLANMDALTSLNNRRHFFELAGMIYDQANRYPEDLTCLMIDIDYFKGINDRYGHQTGDEVLRSLANTMLSSFRTTDVIGRIGGEEFAVLLRRSDVDTAILIAERLRISVEKQAINHEDKSIHITISIGLALRQSDEGLEDTLRKADNALYDAKRKGRNQTCIAE